MFTYTFVHSQLVYQLQLYMISFSDGSVINLCLAVLQRVERRPVVPG